MPSASSFAKLNLTLHITGRRADGYHLLQSLVAFAAVGDQLTVEPDDQLSLMVDGPFSGGLETAKDNLVLKAAHFLREATGMRRGAKILLEKHLPLASGIGGGSGDAALALRLLASLWQCSPDTALLDALALRLGADVPACLHGRAGWMEGIGEHFSLLSPFPSGAVILVNPCQPLPTAQVFAEYKRSASGFSPTEELPKGFADFDALADYLASRHNDLLSAASLLFPGITPRLTALEALPMVRIARLSGSGATCFGLCATEADAAAAASLMREAFPNDWVASAALR